MKILAFETSCEIASVALLCDGDLYAQTLVSPPAHSTTLLPTIRQLLATHRIALADLDVIAFGRGPGAFTGVRLACSIAQGLAVGAGLPLAAVDSLLALAQATQAQRVYCAMDARMSEVYVARYVRNAAGSWQTELAPCCVAPAALPIPESDDWLGVGTAFRAYPECVERLADKVRVQDATAVPTAVAVAQLAAHTDWQDPATATPLYVRDRVALTVAERLAAGGKA